MKSTFLSLLLIAHVVVAVPAFAQQAASLGPARVTLVAGPSPSRGGRIEVLRRARNAPQNIVIVDRNATADDLVAALALINALRLRQGDTLTSDFRARTESVRHDPDWNDSEYRKWLVAQLVRLRQAKESQFSDLGVVRAVQITLPAPRTSASTAPGGPR